MSCCGKKNKSPMAEGNNEAKEKFPSVSEAVTTQPRNNNFPTNSDNNAQQSTSSSPFNSQGKSKPYSKNTEIDEENRSPSAPKKAKESIDVNFTGTRYNSNIGQNSRSTTHLTVNTANQLTTKHSSSSSKIEQCNRPMSSSITNTDNSLISTHSRSMPNVEQISSSTIPSAADEGNQLTGKHSSSSNKIEQYNSQTCPLTAKTIPNTKHSSSSSNLGQNSSPTGSSTALKDNQLTAKPDSFSPIEKQNESSTSPSVVYVNNRPTAPNSSFRYSVQQHNSPTTPSAAYVNNPPTVKDSSSSHHVEQYSRPTSLSAAYMDSGITPKDSSSSGNSDLYNGPMRPSTVNTDNQLTANYSGSTTNVEQRSNPSSVSVDLSKVVSIDGISSETEIARLSILQIKTILTNEKVNYKDLTDRKEFTDKLKALWQFHQKQKSDISDGKMSEGPTCKICMCEPINCVFLECGHMMSCIDCSSRIKECPICKYYITRVVRVFPT